MIIYIIKYWKVLVKEYNRLSKWFIVDMEDSLLLVIFSNVNKIVSVILQSGLYKGTVNFNL